MSSCPPSAYTVTEVRKMNSLELTGAVTALANAIACRLTVDAMALVAGILVQLGDTIATIAAREGLRDNKNSPEC